MLDLWNFGPNDTNRLSWMCPTEIKQRSSEIQPNQPTFWSTFDAHTPSGANWLKPKKSYWEEKDGVRWEKSWDLSSGSRRGWEFLQTNCEKSAIISLVWRREGESLQIFSSFEKRNLKRFSPVSSGERLFSHHTGAYPSYKILCHDTLFHIWRQDS